MSTQTEAINTALKNSFSYIDYLEQQNQLVLNGKSSGNSQSDELSNYTKLNHARLKRLTKTQKVNDEIIATINSLTSKITFLVLTESWCGDAAQTVPVIYKIAEQSKNIDLKIAYRDENSSLMNQFLTNGNQAIPKLIILDTNNKVIADWGPRPTTATQMVNNYKKEHGGLDATFKQNLQVWYNKDKGADTLNDLNNLLKNLL
ncbi:thiol-disulfide isomerase/thioredoxin [Wenyingzhuangia heitensis]|uniref:Thiol-disulfide isomerase/thioredoxin n=1 Tax=Wenyingzhuangia heitensis TaxID=1487859 RepID=A0ABX0U6E3_9FLAO|nr:thioredoxin family protein [Wenyingzhuangia heitensis]NIJ44419.1 thiol-disulfide isomerase/thioredoxin [Wenyingzhuangia heitensis]